MARYGPVWIAFLVSVLAGAVLVSMQELAWGLLLLGLPLLATTVLTLAYYLRERSTAKRESERKEEE